MKRKTALILLFFIILSYPFLIKYNYIAHNQYEQLPLILRSLNPDYLKNDWFVNSGSQFSPRYFYTIYIGSLSKLAGLPLAYFSNYLLMTGLLAAATFYFTHKIFRNEFISVLTTATILYGQKFTLGGNDLIGRDFDPSRLSFSLIIMGIVLLLNYRYFVSSFLFAFAFYIHPLIGLEGPLIFYIALLICSSTGKSITETHSNRNKILVSLFVYLFLSVFSFYSYGSMFLANTQSHDLNNTIILLLTKITLPFHYSPTSWPLIAYVRYFSYFLLFVISYCLIRKIIPDKENTFIKIIIVLIFSLCVIGFIFTDIFPIYPIVISQLFRLTVIVYWLTAVILYGSCFYLSQKKHLAKWKKLSVFTIPLLLSQTDIIRFSGLTNLFFIFLTFAVSFFLLFLNKKFLFLIILLLVINFSLIYRHYEFVYDRLYPFLTPETSLALWVKNNTSESSVFLTPPSFFRFRLIARRSVIADWLAGSFHNEQMIQWFNRLKDVSGLNTTENKFISESLIYEGYKKIDLKRLDYLKSKYNFDYLIMEKNRKLPFHQIYSDSDYVIYEVK